MAVILRASICARASPRGLLCSQGGSPCRLETRLHWHRGDYKGWGADCSPLAVTGADEAAWSSRACLRDSDIVLLVPRCCCYFSHLNFNGFTCDYPSCLPVCWSPFWHHPPVDSLEQWQRDGPALRSTVWPHGGGEGPLRGADWPHHAQQQVRDASGPGCTLREAGGGEDAPQRTPQPPELQH